jgi:FkbM family methyltransferase
MPGLPQFFRSTVLSCSPELAHLYRLLRDRRAAAAPAVPLPFGFTFAGAKEMRNGSYETEEIGVFLDCLEAASLCVDVGANVGLYTCLAASRGKQVVAVEPVAENLKVLYGNLLANGFTDVEVLPVGLSSQAGIKRMYGTGGCASFVKDWAGAPTKLWRAVPVSTLDSLLPRRPSTSGVGPVLIKMDVEGFELEVLSGAEQTLGMKPRPTWMVEICLNEGCVVGGCNQGFRETFEVFWRHGYQARVANAGRQIVGQEEVTRWARNGMVDFGSSNYLFC